MVPKVSSLFSLFGSTWIPCEVLFDRNAPSPKRKLPYHRLLLGMSVYYDILESVWNFASTWAIPEGTKGVWHPRGFHSNVFRARVLLDFVCCCPNIQCLFESLLCHGHQLWHQGQQDFCLCRTMYALGGLWVGLLYSNVLARNRIV